MIEIFSHNSGVEFDQAWERRIEEVIDERTGLKASFISAADFITNKLAAARPQDIADAAAVRRASEVGRTLARPDATETDDDGSQS